MNRDPRYGEAIVADRPDLLLCKECSTRTTVVHIPTDERDDHDAWHAAAAND